MWEVVWTDPDRELRKDRRERKTSERGKRDNKYQASRSSISTRSSSSSGSKPFTSHSSVSRTQVNAQRPLSPTASSVSIASRLSHDVHTDGTCNALLTAGSHHSQATSAEPTSSTRSQRRRPLQIKDPATIFHEPYSPLQSPKLSPSSFWHTALAGSVAVESCHLIQTLGPGSIIIRSTEIVISSRTAEKDAASMGSTATITANILEEYPSRPESSASQSQSSISSRAPGGLFPPERPPLHTLRRAASWNTAPNTPCSDSWKPPNAWDCTTQVEMPEAVAADGDAIPHTIGVDNDNAAQFEEIHDIKPVNAGRNRNRVIQIAELDGVHNNSGWI